MAIEAIRKEQSNRQKESDDLPKLKEIIECLNDEIKRFDKMLMSPGLNDKNYSAALTAKVYDEPIDVQTGIWQRNIVAKIGIVNEKLGDKSSSSYGQEIRDQELSQLSGKRRNFKKSPPMDCDLLDQPLVLCQRK